MKRECGGKWQKYYVNQVVHRVMFEVLLRCYRTVRVYRNEIYEVIADQLNMKRAITDALQIEDGDDEDSDSDDDDDQNVQGILVIKSKAQ